MKRALVTLLGLALLAGCAASGSQRYRDPDYEGLGIRTVAVLPVWNQTQVQMAFEPVRDALAQQLATDKHYAVVSPAEVGRVLGTGAGAYAYSQLVNHLSKEEPVPGELYARLARALDADALLSAQLLAYHQVPEQGPTTNMQGGIYYQNVDVTVVELSAELWSRRTGAPVWRDRFLDRQYAGSRTGRPAIQAVVGSAVRGLLESLPANQWAPVQAPSPTPVPRPVTSLAPLPWPADPQRNR